MIHKDIVNSVGLIPRRPPFTPSNVIVRTLRLPVSLDGRRANFKANHWNRAADTEANRWTSGQKPKADHPKPQVLRAVEKFSKGGNQSTNVEEV
ncbi:hypothetical protein Hypma_002730 [Hypsizygus marmoreus]|uniref:Uncharacterized protein n=1 Tax=Hypsizygus marmoreus TaxID=39966 RepID=A0A369J4N7_HYPMA|nr:hypothetical protein Hypma_002730 [Hypsizygus marmoreus]